GRRGRGGEVAEGAQRVARLAVLGGARLERLRGGERAQVGLEPVHAGGARGGQVPLLAGIAAEVVQLRQRQLDVLLGPTQDAGERRPAAVGGRGERLEVQRGRGCAAAAG